MGLATLGAVTEEMSARLTMSRLRTRGNRLCARAFQITFPACIVNAHNRRVKLWEIIADNLSKAGFTCGCVSAIDSNGRTIWIADAHGYGKRFIVRADEILTAFVSVFCGKLPLCRQK